MKKLFISLIVVGVVFSTVILAISSNINHSSSTQKVAMVTDFGDVDDNSFNQQTFEGCKHWCEDNNVPFAYYKPTSNSHADRAKSVELAIERGYNVLYLPGYTFGPIIAEYSTKYPNVKFMGIDIYPTDLPKGFECGKNVTCFTYQEETAGYLAGYAAVYEGFRKHGFLGGLAGMTVTKFGYGYAQGMDAAAKELKLTEKLDLNFVYGGQFFGDSDITKYIDNWYKSGTEVVFSCGGSIYTSVALAAKDNNKKIIGVDTDQSFVIEKNYGPGLCVTSAMKNISQTCYESLNALKKGVKFEETFIKLGLESSEELSSNFVGLPIETWSMKNFTIPEYCAVVEEILKGKRIISSDTSEKPKLDFVNLIDQGSIK